MIIFAFLLLASLTHFNVNAFNHHSATHRQSFAQLRRQEATISQEERPTVRLPKRLDLLAEDRAEEVSPVSARLSGYIAYLVFGQTRQMVGLGDDFYTIVPQKKDLDVCKNDVNARGSLNSSILETRMRGEFYGPTILSAQTFGYLETDAFGSGTLINRFRIRHAYIKMMWNTISAKMGLFWHPLVVTYAGCYPNVVNFDGGVPTETIARQPQLRLVKEWNHVRLIITALSQLRFRSNGPIGFSSTYLRNAAIPNFNGQMHYFCDESNLVGVSFDYKKIAPRIETNKNFKVHESVSSFCVTGFAAGLFGDFHIASKVGYIENGTDLLNLGGYAVRCVSPVTDERDYTPIRNTIAWVDMELYKKWSPGLFIGFTKNLGARKNIITSITDGNVTESTLYTLLDGDIDYALRVTPRLRVNLQPVTLAGEVNFVRAAYGTIDEKGKVKDTNPVNSVRFGVGAYLFF